MNRVCCLLIALLGTQLSRLRFLLPLRMNLMVLFEVLSLFLPLSVLRLCHERGFAVLAFKRCAHSWSLRPREWGTLRSANAGASGLLPLRMGHEGIHH